MRTSMKLPFGGRVIEHLPLLLAVLASLTGPPGCLLAMTAIGVPFFFSGKTSVWSPWYNRQRQNNGAAAILQGDLSYLFHFLVYLNLFLMQCYFMII